MEIIKKQNKFITNEKHLEYLQRLKRCQENHLNGVFSVSIKLHTAKHKTKTKDCLKEDLDILNVINDSISFYKQTI
jgi:hypothetical protein